MKISFSIELIENSSGRIWRNYVFSFICLKIYEIKSIFVSNRFKMFTVFFTEFFIFCQSRFWYFPYKSLRQLQNNSTSLIFKCFTVISRFWIQTVCIIIVHNIDTCIDNFHIEKKLLFSTYTLIRFGKKHSEIFCILYRFKPIHEMLFARLS